MRHLIGRELPAKTLVVAIDCGKGLGRPPEGATVAAMLGAVRHRRALVGVRKVTQQRLHDQLNVLCPGLSAPVGHGRALALEDTSGQVLTSLPGVAQTRAAAFAAHALPIERFPSAEHGVSSYAA